MRFIIILLLTLHFPALASSGKDPATSVNIISIQGDGMHALASIPLLRKIEEDLKKPIHGAFTVISGNNMGGVVALALATGRFSVPEVFNAIHELGEKSYKNRRLATLFGAHKFSTDNYAKALTAIFGDLRLSDLVTNVIVPAYEDTTKEHKIFSTFAARKNENENYYLRDIAFATTSNPVYFHTKIIRSGSQELKFSKNSTLALAPSLVALAESHQNYPEETPFEIVTIDENDRSIAAGRSQDLKLVTMFLKPQDRHFCFNIALREGCESTTEFSEKLIYSGEDTIEKYEYELKKLREALNPVAKLE